MAGDTPRPDPGEPGPQETRRRAPRRPGAAKPAAGASAKKPAATGSAAKRSASRRESTRRKNEAADSIRPAGPAAGGAPIALYRRYRPATFAEVRGQEHVTEPLRQALRSGRVHHAYLFSGPRGCGKTSSARILARSLNCEQGPTPDPCGVCASCEALAPAGPGSIDVIEIDAASHGGVDDARDLRERAFYAPVGGRFKIYIVDEAHMVTREGFNALLKLVEEPPPHLKFVFATTEPEKVIPTIRSRTHHYPFRLMAPAVLRGLLEEVLASEGVRYEPAVLPVVIRASAGSARDALSVLDQLLAGSDDAGLTYERAVALLGYTDDSLLDEVVEAFAAGDGAAAFRAVERVMEGGHDPRRFATDLLDRFRDLIVLAAVPDAAKSGLLDLPADRLDRMSEQAGRFGQAELAHAAETINAGLTEMRGATSPRLLLELTCAQVLLPGPGSGERALQARIERLERRLDPGAAAVARPAAGSGAPAGPPVARQEAAPAAGRIPAEAPGPAQPAAGLVPSGRAQPPAALAQPPSGRAQGSADAEPAGSGADAATLRSRWPDILDTVRSGSRVAWTLLSSASVDSLADNVLTLRFAREGEARAFTASSYDQNLVRVLQQKFRIAPRVRAVAGPAERTGPAGMAGGRPGPDDQGGDARGPDDPRPHDPGPPDPRSGPRPGGDAPADAGRRPGSGPAGPAAPDEPPRNHGRAYPAAAGGQRLPGRDHLGGAADPGHGPGGEPMSAMDLIERELGGRVIEEYGED
jgi:DNA polymerase-3 subunit gamma/tau